MEMVNFHTNYYTICISYRMKYIVYVGVDFNDF